jgi:capsule polysaccharide export protein KpsE/RkpR
MEKKNRIALSTVDFIDSQISDVADSLSMAQSALQSYRTTEGVMDLSFQGQQMVEQISRLEDQRASFEQQRKYYESLKNYLASNNDIST